VIFYLLSHKRDKKQMLALGFPFEQSGNGNG